MAKISKATSPKRRQDEKENEADLFKNYYL